MIKILIADDHPIVREGVKQILAEESGLEVAGEAHNFEEVLDRVGNQDLDIVLLDITMPGKSGLEALKELHQKHPKLPVLVLTMHPEDQYGVRALRAGASGYLNKTSAPDKLIYAIRTILSGRKYVSPALAEKLAGDVQQNGNKFPHETLSDREYQVMCMIAAGKTVTEISLELSLNVKTVSTYRARILEKMKMRNNAEISHYAISCHLIS